MRKIKLTKKQKRLLSEYIEKFRNNVIIHGFDKRTDKALVKKNILEISKDRKRYGKTGYEFTSFGIKILEDNGIHINPPNQDIIDILERIPVYDEYLNLIKETKEAEKLWHEANNKKYKAEDDASCIGDLIDEEKLRDSPLPSEIPDILKYEEDKTESKPT